MRSTEESLWPVAAWQALDPRCARSLTDDVDDDASVPDALETADALDAHLARTGRESPVHAVRAE
jgi:hypothetical protein